MDQIKAPKILALFEPVTFPEFAKIGQIEAKIDTGAKTGALHCTKIREETTPEGKFLHFSPFDHPETEITVDEFFVDYVRSSNGDGQDRYFIRTTVKIQGETYPVVLSLANRSDMKSPVLIGSGFLRQHKFLVDVSKKPEKRVEL